MKFFTFSLCILILTCCKPVAQQQEGNGLMNETSPYLLQHAHNPVNWNPWSDQVLEQAVQEGKLIIISIGYAACHWCHVMEEESFEDSLVALKMNKSFISIKVDREERPDIDQIYMNAAYLLTGKGGWPLNVIALPNGQPVYAGTYFPKEQWEKVLDYFSNLYQNDPARLTEQAEKLTQGIKEVDQPTFSQKGAFNDSIVHQINASLMNGIDLKNGGKKGSPKFPMPSVFEYLLTQDFYHPDPQFEEVVKTTLNAMAFGGIYDHLGGGFARYSVDDTWTVPHFEKMLYDNAQLVSLYSHAYQKYKDPNYAQVVKETIDFCNRELRAPNGAYFSSIDADSEGEEGKYYLWSEKEIDNLLQDQSAVFKSYYGVSKGGNFESKNILEKKMTFFELSQKYNRSLVELEQSLEQSKKRLMTNREQRVKPNIDDKSLTSWNALMIIGLLDAYAAFGKQDYLKDALLTAGYIEGNQLQEDGMLFRNYEAGKSTIHAFLDDYAITALAFIKLYESTFDEEWLYKAEKIKTYVNAHFLDNQTQMYYYTSALNQKLIARKMELSDNVIPSSNSMMANVLILLGQYLFNEEDLNHAEQMIANSLNNVVEYPDFYSNWARIYSISGQTHYEVAIVGSDFEAKRKAIAKLYLPNKIILGGHYEGTLKLLNGKYNESSTLIYVCHNKSCQLPVTEVEQTLQQMKP
ncbi:thioredoxin domain-containing protein [Flammeovirga sp. EKP202]|uniref:thioredoxin domain-containing protein n=1 Tax=Flammeovirga sp. EKP202 TaxID=2770592 RepID=UPI00165EDA18|nr:thioredoxin domain-containing protein [Flammeovirga sp. EKP202]MBD0403468.1 thioredoxin domain-containing protein [Flammeovirga sp. EKP202]